MSKLDSPWRAFALVSLIGIDLAVSVLLGFWGGRYIDQMLGSEPAFLIIGILAGLAAGIYGVMRIIKPFIGD
jgi:ATP synthase protein I